MSKKGVIPPGFKTNAAKKSAGGAAKTPPSKGGAMPMSDGTPAFVTPPRKASGRGKGKGKGC